MHVDLLSRVCVIEEQFQTLSTVARISRDENLRFLAYATLGNHLRTSRQILEDTDSLHSLPTSPDNITAVAKLQLNPFPVFSSTYLDAVGDAVAFSMPWSIGRRLLASWTTHAIWPTTGQLMLSCGKSIAGSAALISSVFVYDLITRSYIQQNMSQNFIALWYGPLQWAGAISLALLVPKLAPFSLVPTWASLIENNPRVARFISKPNYASDWFMRNVLGGDTALFATTTRSTTQ